MDAYQNAFQELELFVYYSTSRVTDFKSLERNAEAMMQSIKDKSQKLTGSEYSERKCRSNFGRHSKGSCRARSFPASEILSKKPKLSIRMLLKNGSNATISPCCLISRIFRSQPLHAQKFLAYTIRYIHKYSTYSK